MLEELTSKQRECLNVIIKYKEQHEFSPTIREICKLMNLSSPATVFVHLSNLKDKGYIDWNENQSRTIKVLNTGEIYEFDR